MKIYLSEKKPSNTEFTHVTNIINLDNVVEDNEATQIILDDFLRVFKITEIETVVKKVLTKLRINGSIVISDVDVDVITSKYNRGDMNLEEFNTAVFENPSSNLINIEFLREVISKLIKIKSMSLDQNSGKFVIEGTRSND